MVTIISPFRNSLNSYLFLRNRNRTWEKYCFM